jgi:RNA polymerase II subunit A-like phosphatase
MSKQSKRRRVDSNPAAPQQCLHDIIVFGNICAKCGTSVELPQLNTTGTTRLTLNGGKNILLTQRGAREDAMRNVSALMGRRKLALVLDLDHTLLHATPDPRVAERGWDLASPDIHKIELREARHRPPAYHYVKLRTGVRKLLKECHECYQLYIYTHGTRQYAEAIAKVIDPSSIYFQGRIISRSDNPDGMQHKELSQMFPCDATMALILDDRMDVWPSDLHNLIKVKPYHYFRNMADVNNAAGTSITSDAAVPTAPGPTTTEAVATTAATTAAAAAPLAIPLPVEHDDELTHVLRVLLNVHATFYQQLNGGTGASSSSSSSSSSSHGTGKRRRDEEDTAVDPSTLNAMVTNQVDGRGPSVQKILRQIRENVFSGVHMVFSGIIQKNTGMPAHEHPTWKQAELFGASVR